MATKKPKFLHSPILSRTPPQKKKVVFGIGLGSQNRYSAQTVLLSNIKKLLLSLNHKLKDMLYSNKKADFSGLSVRGGRLINDQPDGKTGIQKMAQLRKDVKAAKKIAQIAEGTHMGNMMHNMMGGCSECGEY